MEARSVGILYLKSSAFILIFIAGTISVALATNFLFACFIHGIRHEGIFDVMAAVVIMPPIMAVVGVVAATLVLTLPQSFEAFLTWKMTRRIGTKGRFSTLVALPATAVLTWYCFDYLTPSDFNLGINEGADWEPYKHGLTFSRWIPTLVIQAFVTVFNLSYMQSQLMSVPTKTVIFAVLGLAGFIGCVFGYFIILDQYQSL